MTTPAIFGTHDDKTLAQLADVMAGENEYDPYKD